MIALPCAAEIEPPAPDRPYARIDAAPGQTLDDVPHDWLLDLYKTHGALLLRGFGGDLDGFRRVSNPFCASWVINDAHMRDVLDADSYIQTVNRGTAPFPLHAEISRAPWRPDICFFYCIDPPGPDGGTCVCDGVAIVRALPEAVRAALAGERLRFTSPARSGELTYWLGSETPDDATLAAPPSVCPYRYTRDGDEILQSFSRPMLRPPMFSEAPAFATFLLFARDMFRNRDNPALDDGTPVPDAWVEAIRSTSAALTVHIVWQAGDLLILDNSRFMHGRGAIDPNMPRLIASRFGYLKDAPLDPEEPADPIWRRMDFRPPG